MDGEGEEEKEREGKRRRVARVDVMFLAEDPFLFVNRVAAAHQARKEAEAQLVLHFQHGVSKYFFFFDTLLQKYNIYIDSMPPETETEAGSGMAPGQLAKILQLVHAPKRHRGLQGRTQEMQLEVARLYDRAISKVLYIGIDWFVSYTLSDFV